MGNVVGRKTRTIISMKDVEERVDIETLRLWEDEFKKATGRADLQGRLKPRAFHKCQFVHEQGLLSDGEAAAFKERTFGAVDITGKGWISFEEFACALLIVGASGLVSEKMKLTFRLYDSSSTGYIGFMELHDVLAALSEADASLLTTDDDAPPKKDGVGSSSSTTVLADDDDKDGGGKASKKRGGGSSGTIQSKGKGKDKRGGRIGRGSSGGGGKGKDAIGHATSADDDDDPFARMPPGRAGEAVREIFNTFDKNKDQRLSYLEFVDFLDESHFARNHLKSFLPAEF
jgi:Ca2+-binding EF-hand superfamily protein